MRRLMLLVGAVLVVLAVAGSGAAVSTVAGSSRSVTLGGPIVELKADAGRAIALIELADSESSVKVHCADVVVWRPSTGASVVVVDHVREQCRGFDILGAYYGVALAGSDAVWVQSGGGNTFETLMFVSPLATGRSDVVGRAGAGGQGGWGSFVANAQGDRELLVYNSYNRCVSSEYSDVQCPPGYKDRSISSDQIVMERQARRTVATSGRDLTVLAVGGGRIVAREWSGPLIVLAPTRAAAPRVAHENFNAERLIATYRYKRGEVRAAATDGRTLAVLRKGALDVIPLPGSSGSRIARTVPNAFSYGPDRPVACLEGPILQFQCTSPQLRLVDLDGNIAVYIRRNAVYLLDLKTGRSIVIAQPTTTPVNAQLEPDGLYISAGNTLTFTPRSQVEQRLHR